MPDQSRIFTLLQTNRTKGRVFWWPDGDFFHKGLKTTCESLIQVKVKGVFSTVFNIDLEFSTFMNSGFRKFSTISE